MKKLITMLCLSLLSVFTFADTTTVSVGGKVPITVNVDTQHTIHADTAIVNQVRDSVIVKMQSTQVNVLGWHMSVFMLIMIILVALDVITMAIPGVTPLHNIIAKLINGLNRK